MENTFPFFHTFFTLQGMKTVTDDKSPEAQALGVFIWRKCLEFAILSPRNIRATRKVFRPINSFTFCIFLLCWPTQNHAIETGSAPPVQPLLLSPLTLKQTALCHAEQALANCQDFFKKNPEEKESFRTCSLQEQAQEQFEPAIMACFEGMARGTLDTKEALMHVLESFSKWKQMFHKNLRLDANFRKKVDQDIRLKVALVQGHPFYDPLLNSRMSLDQLKNYPSLRLIPEMEKWENEQKTEIVYRNYPVYKAGQMSRASWAEGPNYSVPVSSPSLFSIVESIAEKELRSLLCYKPKVRAATLCYAGTWLADQVLLAATPTWILQKAPKAVSLMKAYMGNKIHPSSQNLARQEIIERYEKIEPTITEQNRSYFQWILAHESGKLKGRHFRFLRFEQTAMKTLNDSTNNKPFVTSITNLGKKEFFTDIQNTLEALESQGMIKNLSHDLSVPQIHLPEMIAKSSDFKSGEFMYELVDPRFDPVVSLELQKAFKEANARFYHQAKEVIVASDHPENFFRGGLATSADSAALRSRYARTLEENQLVTHLDMAATDALLKNFADFRTLHRLFLKQPRIAMRLMEDATSVTGMRVQTFNIKVFEILRKKKTIPEIQKAFRQKFGVNLQSDDAENLIRYYELIDGFNPALRVERRNLVDFSRAKFGAISIDHIGMGAKNSQATAIELSAVQNGSTETAIEYVRQGEQQLTLRFKKLNRQLRSSFKTSLSRQFTFTHSGDDVGVIFTQKPWNSDYNRTAYRGATLPEESGQILHSLAQIQDSLDYRIVFLGDDLWDASGGMMIGHGENFLKDFSESLESALLKFFDNEKDLQNYLKQTMITAQMNGTTVGYGDIQLMIYSKSEKNISQDFLQAIASQMNRTIAQLNNEIQTMEKIPSRYTTSPVLYYFQPEQQQIYHSIQKSVKIEKAAYVKPNQYPLPDSRAFLQPQ